MGGKEGQIGAEGGEGGKKSAGNLGLSRFLSPCNGCGMRGEAGRNLQRIFSDKLGLLKHI